MDTPRDQTRDPEEMLNPSDLMRARHPDLFSDTVVEEVELLPNCPPSAPMGQIELIA